ncbi:MAG: ATP-dependent Clp protease ATP-binding subunit ClpX, partial [Clostridia bacterium]|nr:ATP-dependent Clp protease ATP-binding subunit ClpX [Clostridia bacterium]
DIVKERLNAKQALGFNSVLKEDKEKKAVNFTKDLQPQDLIKFGLIPEFVGRLPVTVGLNDLTEGALVKILTEPKNSIIKQYKKMFKIDGVELDFEPEAIRAVAQKAIKLKTGARGLRTILEDAMLDVMFDTPTDNSIEKVIVPEKYIIDRSSNIQIIRKEKPAQKASGENE